MTIELATGSIADLASFHAAFAELLGFPDFYGGNMDAWIDCMAFVRDPEAGMTRLHVAADEQLLIIVRDAEDFRRRLPDVFASFVDCTAFTNRRFVEWGELPAIALVLA